jgi:signal peptidase I
LIKEKTETSQFVKIGGEFLLDAEASADVIRLALAKKASLRLQVKGFSMSPFIKDSDIITLSPLPEGMIGLGWSIAFMRPRDKKLVIHRLVKICKRPHVAYVTKGDSTDKPDCPISRNDILAYVKKAERGGRMILFGTGPERIVIACLSRLNILQALFFFWRLIIPSYIRQKIKERLYF